MCPFTWGIVGLCTNFLLVLKYTTNLVFTTAQVCRLPVCGWKPAGIYLIKLKLRQQAGPLLFWSPWGRVNFLFIQVVSRIQFLAVVALRFLLSSGIPCFQKTPTFLRSRCPPPRFLKQQCQVRRLEPVLLACLSISSPFHLWGPLWLHWAPLITQKWSEVLSVVTNSLRPHGLYSPWNSPGQNTGMGSLSLLQGVFPTCGWNPGLPHCRQIVYQLSHKGSPDDPGHSPV